LNQFDHTLDMFPQTSGVEVLAHLAPRGLTFTSSVNVFLMLFSSSLTNTSAAVPLIFYSRMSEFIVAGILVISSVNWLYSRLCEGPRQLLPTQRQGMMSPRRANPA
jgi:hypothetical protein